MSYIMGTWHTMFYDSFEIYIKISHGGRHIFGQSKANNQIIANFGGDFNSFLTSVSLNSSPSSTLGIVVLPCDTTW